MQIEPLPCRYCAAKLPSFEGRPLLVSHSIIAIAFQNILKSSFIPSAKYTTAQNGISVDGWMLLRFLSLDTENNQPTSNVNNESLANLQANEGKKTKQFFFFELLLFYDVLQNFKLKLWEKNERL